MAAQQWNKQEMNKPILDIHCTQFTVFIAFQDSGPHMEEADLRMIAALLRLRALPPPAGTVSISAGFGEMDAAAVMVVVTEGRGGDFLWQKKETFRALLGTGEP
ncbi:unnamed protein product [Arctogadus glacialis]